MKEILVKYLAHSQGISKIKAETMEENKRRILLNYLRDLNIQANEEELKTHEQIAHLDFEASKDFLVEASNWLLKLKQANEQTNLFPTKNMNEVLADYWFKLGSAHLPFGFFTLVHFLKCSLTYSLSLLLIVKLSLLCFRSEIKTFFK
jgi:hypothetical protein